MTFDEILAQVLELLQREQRLSYRALKVRGGERDVSEIEQLSLAIPEYSMISLTPLVPALMSLKHAKRN